jgi:hypothetical protein
MKIDQGVIQIPFSIQHKRFSLNKAQFFYILLGRKKIYKGNC